MASVEATRAERLDRLIPSGIPYGTRGAIDDPRQDHGAPPDLAPLVQLAGDLRRAYPATSAAPAGRRVWARLAPRLEAGRHSPRPTWRLILRPAFVLATLAVIVALGLGTTTAFASEAALPGDVLYPLKLGLEKARLALSTTAAGDATLLAAFADRRVGEIERLAHLGRWDDVDAAVAGYPDLAASLDGLEPDQVEGQLRHHLEVLEQVRSQAPEAALAGLDRALERAAQGRQEVERRRHTPVPHPTRTPGAHEPPGPKKTPPGLERKQDND